MTDLDMVKSCAKAMGYIERDDSNDEVMWDHQQPEHQISVIDPHAAPIRSIIDYDPLNNDGQAMALVKKHYLEITPHNDGSHIVFIVRRFGTLSKPGPSTESDDLNRAIVQCVAEMYRST